MAEPRYTTEGTERVFGRFHTRVLAALRVHALRSIFPDFGFRLEDEVFREDAADWLFQSYKLFLTVHGLPPQEALKAFRRYRTEWYRELSVKLLSAHTGTIVEPNDQMTRLAPLFKKQIEDAFQPLLAPLASALQEKREHQQKLRKTFLALEEKKLAQRRRMIQMKRRRAERFQPTRRAASSARSSRPRTRQGLHLGRPQL